MFVNMSISSFLNHTNVETAMVHSGKDITSDITLHLDVEQQVT